MNENSKEEIIAKGKAIKDDLDAVFEKHGSSGVIIYNIGEIATASLLKGDPRNLFEIVSISIASSEKLETLMRICGAQAKILKNEMQNQEHITVDIDMDNKGNVTEERTDHSPDDLPMPDDKTMAAMIALAKKNQA